jgi:glycosyltransferase involved in cell wall biosynthesis
MMCFHGRRDTNDSRDVIIISPYFPPSQLAGVHRARHLAKHLPAVGWTPIVLCVNEIYQEERLDYTLSKLVPQTVEIVKAKALPAWITRPVALGDISLRAWGALYRKLFRLIQTRHIGAVLITGSPYYHMLLAPAIKRRFGIPVVLDFQDPWVSTWSNAQPALSKGGFVGLAAKVLEPRALRGASFVTSVSDIQNREMVARYPWLDYSRMADIPIGGDPEDFAAHRGPSLIREVVDLEPGYIHLSYVGAFWPAARNPIRTLLRAFARLRAESSDLGRRIRLNFVGTNAQLTGDPTVHVQPLAEAEGIADAVREFPRRLPYLSALGVLSQSNGLLLIGSDEPHYTASKIYPALMSGRPFLSLFHHASSAHAILRAAGGGLTFAFSTAEDLAALEAQLADGLRTLAAVPESLGRVDSSAYAHYEARAVARRFADIFDRLNTNR